jgi:hypothetical protein
VIADGGTLRGWVPDGQADRTRAGLAEARAAGCSLTYTEHPDGRHPHFGDVVGVADEDVALCKDLWVLIDSSGVITNPVVAEHGTDLEADRSVPWWGHTVENGHVGIADDAFHFLTGTGRHIARAPDPH